MGFRACLDLSAGKKFPVAGKTRGLVRSLVHTSSSSSGGGGSSSSSNGSRSSDVVAVVVV